ncbi:MAG: hypothetical protein WC410_01660 [Candidatus Paceibacterota bacterium]|jgi:hypothetical protein|nr:hypothetical protein [Candidatus Paceibacterota bacterium]MDD5555250.1 hypothetical protein [Candidatus Paceibacterota bacterium]
MPEKHGEGGTGEKQYDGRFVDDDIVDAEGKQREEIQKAAEELKQKPHKPIMIS